jgi:hypothetical protein
MISLKGRSKGQEIFNSVYSFVIQSAVPLHKLVSITDGAKSMTGQANNWFYFPL